MCMSVRKSPTFWHCTCAGPKDVSPLLNVTLCHANAVFCKFRVPLMDSLSHTHNRHVATVAAGTNLIPHEQIRAVEMRLAEPVSSSQTAVSCSPSGYVRLDESCVGAYGAGLFNSANPKVSVLGVHSNYTGPHTGSDQSRNGLCAFLLCGKIRSGDV